MKIIDCRSADEFDKVCNELANVIKRDGEDYDLVVAVANGGCLVAQNIIKNINHKGGYLVIKCQRPGTESKEKIKIVKKLVKMLPSNVNNFLRILEVAIAEWKFARRKHQPRNARTVKLIRDCPLPQKNISRILVVDDSVDSGSTLVDVGEFLKERYPQSKLRFAALTITHRQPLVKPDYYVHSRSILKFSWSLDG